MAESTVIREFLVSLGYKTDETAMRKFREGIDNASKAVIKLGAVIETTALAVSVGVARWAGSLENLYFSSQRVGSTADLLQAYGLAARNFGASIEEAQGSVENLAMWLKKNPGGENIIEGWLNRVGLSAKDANGKMLQGAELAARMGQMFKIYRDQGQSFLAFQQAGTVGISDKLLLAMSTPGFAEEFAAMEKRRKGWQRVAEAAHKFEIQLQDLKMAFQQMLLGFEGPAMAALQRLMTAFSQFLSHHGRQAVRDLTEAFEWLIAGMGRLLDWLDAHGGEIQRRIQETFGEVRKSYELIRPAMVWIYDQFVALDRATDGWSTKLIVLAGVLKGIGATGIVTGIAALGAGLAKAFGGLIAGGVTAGVEAGGVWAVAGTAFGAAAAVGIGVGLGALFNKYFPDNWLAKDGDEIGNWAADVHDWLIGVGNKLTDPGGINHSYRVPYAATPKDNTVNAPTTVNTTINVHGNADKNTVTQIGDGVTDAVRRANLQAAIKREFLATVQ
jgi:hypothetical protein